MFYPLYALAVQLSPEQGSSGIQELETDTFRLYCSQTLTGVKFLVVADPKQAGIDQLLDKVKEGRKSNLGRVTTCNPAFLTDLRAVCRLRPEEPVLLAGDAHQGRPL